MLPPEVGHPSRLESPPPGDFAVIQGLAVMLRWNWFVGLLNTPEGAIHDGARQPRPPAVFLDHERRFTFGVAEDL